jgi:hypothetical protein
VLRQQQAAEDVDEDLEDLIKQLESLREADDKSAELDVVMPEGWKASGGADLRFFGPNGIEAGVHDLPVYAYMATLRDYFSYVQAG